MPENKTQYALSIAGFDPSAGAGLLADVKTMEAFGVHSFGVCSALTYQNDVEFIGLDWIPANKIVSQLEPLINRFPIEYIKVGLIENIELIESLELKTPNCKAVWDPILKASAGFVFHKQVDKKMLAEILQNIYLLTPNIPEAKMLSGIENPEEAACWMSQYCAVLLKGGHKEDELASDNLYQHGKLIETFESPMQQGYQKHGSGCVLSAAITANLAKGNDLVQAIKNSKRYINSFISSNDRLLGKHTYGFA